MLITIDKLIARFNINIKGILHIGAHNCEEFGDYISWGVNMSNIYWIEALPILVEQNKRAKPFLNIYQAVIYDEDDKEIDFHITNGGGNVHNLQSSSMLEFGSHKTSHPDVKVVDKVKMKTSRMDSVINKYSINMKNVNFINLDIQGVELHALKSMESYLKNIDYIYSEVSTEEVYKKCDQMIDITTYLAQHNFRLVDEYIYKEYGWGEAFYIKNGI
jgi:FkbM family methyltransferase